MASVDFGVQEMTNNPSQLDMLLAVSTPSVIPTPVGYVFYYYNGTQYQLVVCSKTDTNVSCKQVEVYLGGSVGTGVAWLVDIGDANASNIQIQTPNGIKSWGLFK